MPDATPGAPSSLATPGDHIVKFRVHDGDRRALIHVPPHVLSGAPLPVVIILHGAGATGRLYLMKNGWAELSDAAGFIAVAPEGTPPDRTKPTHFQTNPQLWDDGSGRRMMARLGTDEPAFIVQILEWMQRQLPLHPGRVYLTGHSNGAALAFRLGERLGDRLAAIAPVASHCWIREPRPVRSVPTLYLIGTLDPLVPLAGGEVASPWFPHQKDFKPPVADTLARWVRAMNCSMAEIEVPADPPLRIVEYRGASADAFVRTVYIAGHGHAWPGGQASGLPESIMGPSVAGVDATRLIWEFFRTLQLPASGASR